MKYTESTWVLRGLWFQIGGWANTGGGKLFSLVKKHFQCLGGFVCIWPCGVTDAMTHLSFGNTGEPTRVLCPHLHQYQRLVVTDIISYLILQFLFRPHIMYVPVKYGISSFSFILIPGKLNSIFVPFQLLIRRTNAAVKFLQRCFVLSVD